MAADGRVLDGITLERELLAPLKSLSQNVVDTTELTPRQLRKEISDQFSKNSDKTHFRIEVMSFGFKYGLPLDADLVFDVQSSESRQGLTSQYMIMSCLSKNQKIFIRT